LVLSGIRLVAPSFVSQFEARQNLMSAIDVDCGSHLTADGWGLGAGR
jgi:hypothetical protein